MKIHEATELAYKNGYEAGKPKWISVKERLPENVQEVLVIRMNGEPDIEFLLYDGTWVGDTPGRQDKVTHWMPLPEPPEKVE